MQKVHDAMSRAGILLGAVLLIAACSPSSPPSSSAAVPAPAPAVALAPGDFTVPQRSTTPLPGSDGRLLLTIDDITRGQVMAGVAWGDGAPLVAVRSMREGDAMTLKLGEETYTLTLTDLTNVLVGDDYAKFTLQSAAAKAAAVPADDAAEPAPASGGMSEDAKIEALIQAVGALEGARFVRNGDEHPAADAMEHMRAKWDWKRDDIKTAKDFIRVVGSKSSVSGKPYLIRMADGTEVQAGEWFRARLAELERGETRPEGGG